MFLQIWIRTVFKYFYFVLIPLMYIQVSNKIHFILYISLHFNNNSMVTLLKMIDYRNAKYHGQMKANAHQGFGMLLKDDFTFVAGQWQNNQLNGLAFIIYPNCITFFGTFKQSKPNGLCFYNLPNQVNLYTKFKIGTLGNQIAIVLEKDHLILQGTLRKEKQLQVDFVQAITFKDRDERNRIIQSITKCTINIEMINWINFLQHAQRTYPTLLELVHIKRNKIKQICFGFKNITGLGCSFNIDGQILSLGLYNKEFILKELGRKIVRSYGQSQIEQGNYIDMDLVYIYDSQDSRPIEVNRIISTYFKQSIQFSNNFYDFKPINEYSQFASLFSKKIFKQMLQRYQEVQIQKSKPQTEVQYINPQEYSLLEIKKDIFAAIDRKNSQLKSQSKLSTKQPKLAYSHRYQPLQQRSVEKYNYDRIIYDYSKPYQTSSRLTENFDNQKKQLDKFEKKLDEYIQNRNKPSHQFRLSHVDRNQGGAYAQQTRYRHNIAQTPVQQLDDQFNNKESKRKSYQDSQQKITSFSFIRQRQKKPKVKLSQLTEIYKQIQQEIEKRETPNKNKYHKNKFNYRQSISPRPKNKQSNISSVKTYTYT